MTRSFSKDHTSERGTPTHWCDGESLFLLGEDYGQEGLVGYLPEAKFNGGTARGRGGVAGRPEISWGFVFSSQIHKVGVPGF